jgi:pilus assembly protein CpaE
MARDVRFIILNADDHFAAEVRSLLLQIPGVRIIAEVEESALLPQAVQQFPVDVVLVNLDPAPDAVLPLVADVASAKPELAVFAASKSTEGPLILKVMRTGIREFLPKPIDLTAITEAIEKIASQRTECAVQGKLITVMGTAGGVGASVLAVNLAVELAALASGRVVLVDLDYRFGQVGTMLDVEPAYTIADLCQSPEAPELAVIERALVKHDSGDQVLCRPGNFAQADVVTAASCVGLLTALLQHSQFVVADGPTRFETNAQPVFDNSDVNLLVTQLLVPSVRNGLRILEGLREHGYNMERVKLICNRIGRESSNLTVQDVADTLGKDVLATVPDDWAAVSGAINLGEPLAAHGPKSRVRQAIQKIAERLHTPESRTDDSGGPKKGLIGRIFAAS